MGVLKCIIWGVGIIYDHYINLIKYQELLGNIEVAGVTSNQSIYKKVDGYQFIPKDELIKHDFDLLIIASIEAFHEIRTEAISFGIHVDKIIHIKVFALNNFNVQKYVTLKNSKLSIIANNCWGGWTYNKLGMEFLSPTINMFIEPHDYITMLKDLKKYIEQDVEFSYTKYEINLKIDFPVCNLADVKLHFNHYRSYNEAVEKWNSRKNRINWDNLFIMMVTKDSKLASDFINLPYKNKVCFVPFESLEPSLINVNFDQSTEFDIWARVNSLVTGQYKCYDTLDLLLGRINTDRII